MVTKCETGNAVIKWTPGADNNDPITNFVAYYNTSMDEPGDCLNFNCTNFNVAAIIASIFYLESFYTGTYHEACHSKAHLERCIVDLRPWSNFTFHVVSKNSVGFSERSDFSTQHCTTRPTTPYRHPNKVCTVSRNPNSLVIVWEVRMICLSFELI